MDIFLGSGEGLTYTEASRGACDHVGGHGGAILNNVFENVGDNDTLETNSLTSIYIGEWVVPQLSRLKLSLTLSHAAQLSSYSSNLRLDLLDVVLLSPKQSMVWMTCIRGNPATS